MKCVDTICWKKRLPDHNKRAGLYSRAIQILFCLLLLVSFPFTVWTDDANTARIQLEDLREKISILQSSLDKVRNKYDSQQKDLRGIERRIGTSSRRLRQLDDELGRQEKKLQQLATLKKDLQQDLGTHREIIASHVRASYAMGRQEYLKMLLNQEQPALIGRMLTYYDYMNRARAAQVSFIDNKVTELNMVSDDIVRQKESLLATRQKIVDERRTLTSERQQRKVLLASLGKDIASQEQQLSRFKEDELRLENLVNSIREVVKQVAPPMPVNTGAFRNLRGRLPWPARGELLARFGSAYKGDRLRRQGVVIGASEGDTVAAVASGRVVFSDWLRGFGLMLIIDHGGGYMSLYGHNQNLLKATGDWVEAGEAVASAGNSGGQARSGLYFEIRDNGKPVNPLQWLARSGNQ
jgi:septal ring factor EnvC (AmiA/AmiB activator)